VTVTPDEFSVEEIPMLFTNDQIFTEDDLLAFNMLVNAYLAGSSDMTRALGMGDALSAGIGMIPIVGDCYDGACVLAGKDLITGDKFGALDYVASVAGFLLPIVPGSALRGGVNIVQAAKHTDVRMLAKGSPIVWVEDMNGMIYMAPGSGATTLAGDAAVGVQKRGGAHTELVKLIGGDAETVISGGITRAGESLDPSNLDHFTSRTSNHYILSNGQRGRPSNITPDFMSGEPGRRASLADRINGYFGQ
jgi:hypothetical protein